MKQIRITKRPPPRCHICPNVAEFHIWYWDQDGPPPTSHGGSRIATPSKWSCKDHIEPVISIVLKEADLA